MRPDPPAFLWGSGLLVLLAAPWLVDNQFVLLMVSLTGLTYVVALGLSLVLGFAGQASLGHAALFGVGAYTSAILTARAGQPFAVGFLAAGLTAGLVGLLLAVPSLRLAGPYLAMATMAFNLVVQRLMVNWVDLTGGPDGLPGLPAPQLGPILFDRRTSLYLVAALALGGYYLARNLVRSRHGRALLAIRDDELAASCLGVNIYRAKLLVFGLSAIYAGLAGSLFAHLYRHVSPISFGLEASIEFLLAVIVAGRGTLAWPLAGAALVTLLPQLPALQNLQDLRLFAYGALLLLVVAVFRGGLAGAARRLLPGPSETGEVGLAGLANSVVEEPPPGAVLPSLAVHGVRRRFGGVVALDGLDLTVAGGTIHGLIGPNGSGKTTAINVISGVYRPEAGSVSFAGQNLVGRARHRLAGLGLARTFQNLRLFGELSVLQNVQTGQQAWFKPPLFGTLLGLPAARRAEAAAAAAARELAIRLGLGDVLARPAQDLAHGRQRRLELARALAARPKLLLLDEPAAGLSGPEIAELRAELSRARAAGVTILLVEHHLELVLGLCDRVTVLDRGRAIAEGTPAEVRANPAVATAYLGQSTAGVRGDPVEDEVPSPQPSPVRGRGGGAADQLLRVEGASVRYGRVTALAELDLVVASGEIVALLGANGAGKSTVLRAISGLVPLAAGSISFDGRQIGRAAAYQRLARGLAHVPEGRLVFADQSVEDNLRLGAYHRQRLFRREGAAIAADLERLLARFPVLAERRRLLAGGLSGGEQQQLAIARALMARPRLLLLDEPSLGLAPILIDQVFELIAELRREGVTILLVEQLAYRALELADRAYVLRTGQCVLSGPAATLAGDPALESAYLAEM